MVYDEKSNDLWTPANLNYFGLEKSMRGKETVSCDKFVPMMYMFVQEVKYCLSLEWEFMKISDCPLKSFFFTFTFLSFGIVCHCWILVLLIFFSCRPDKYVPQSIDWLELNERTNDGILNASTLITCSISNLFNVIFIRFFDQQD